MSFLISRLRSEAEAHKVAREAYVRMLQLVNVVVCAIANARAVLSVLCPRYGLITATG